MYAKRCHDDSISLRTSHPPCYKPFVVSSNTWLIMGKNYQPCYSDIYLLVLNFSIGTEQFIPTFILKDFLYLIEHVKSHTSFNDQVLNIIPSRLDLWKHLFLSNLLRKTLHLWNILIFLLPYWHKFKFCDNSHLVF